jgi:hypothetical protein
MASGIPTAETEQVGAAVILLTRISEATGSKLGCDREYLD